MFAAYFLFRAANLTHPTKLFSWHNSYNFKHNNDGMMNGGEPERDSEQPELLRGKTSWFTQLESMDCSVARRTSCSGNVSALTFKVYPLVLAVSKSLDTPLYSNTSDTGLLIGVAACCVWQYSGTSKIPRYNNESACHEHYSEVWWHCTRRTQNADDMNADG